MGTHLTLSVPRDRDLDFEICGEQESGAGEEVSGHDFGFGSRVERGFGEGLGAIERFGNLQAGDTGNYELGITVRINP